MTLWEQGSPAMKAMLSFRDRGACFASKLCSHKAEILSLQKTDLNQASRAAQEPLKSSAQERGA
jgi:hypothetical protein